MGAVFRLADSLRLWIASTVSPVLVRALCVSLLQLHLTHQTTETRSGLTTLTLGSENRRNPEQWLLLFPLSPSTTPIGLWKKSEYSPEIEYGAKAPESPRVAY